MPIETIVVDAHEHALTREVLDLELKLAGIQAEKDQAVREYNQRMATLRNRRMAIFRELQTGQMLLG